ncbi:hypothetical protein NEIRO03_1797 [Nematocida sp. AWRm78]|nr:hypothetical protein NEIRO02_1516 [Nematocida sp. AWRm79]KAI5184669.1 hypothetical protein NEIRO03_1797 [Nematocida sp. AWRm78]
MIDYHTRAMIMTLLENRTTEEIKRAMNEWIEKRGKPEEIVTDNAREFISNEIWKYLIDKQIKHRRVSVESHQSNGQVERVIRTIRDALVKIERGQPIEEKLEKIERGYNGRYHKGVECTPEEAWNKDSDKLKERNSKEGEYAKGFKKLAREEFEVGDMVRIAQTDNLGKEGKAHSGRFVEEGTITDRCGNDSYLVRDKKGRFAKRQHYNLKKMEMGMGIYIETLS